jgi:CRP/FNR family transcriptional regulator, anaerobic regulatory protein
MKSACVIDSPPVGLKPKAPISYPRSVPPRVAANAAPLQLQQALAQVEALERALASSQQESIAVQKQVEILTNANAQLRGLTFQREVARSAGQGSAANWGGLCLCAGLDPDAASYIGSLLTKRIRFRKGDVLYRFGDRFDALYAISAGSCKTVLLARDGQDQVSGYHIGGDIIGMDGIGSNVHQCQATALENMEVCLLPFDWIENFAQLSDQFRYNLHKLLSRECSRVQTLTLVLGTMSAEKRLAVFLLELSLRYKARGYSSCEFVLRMTRGEIGSYLGLKLETVSRQFARIQREGLIQVEGRVVKLLDRAGLSRLVDCTA